MHTLRPSSTRHVRTNREDDPTTHLRGDGTVFPPVTPDPPAPPGYQSPLDDCPALLDLTGRSDAR